MDVPNNENLGQNFWPNKDETNNVASNQFLFQERRMDPPSQNNDYRYLRDEYGNLFKVYLPQTTQNIRANEYELFNKDPHLNLASNYGHSENFHVNSPPLSQPQHEHVNSQIHQVSPMNQATKTNMFINQLVGNWSPNLSGTYSPFGEPVVNSPASNPLPSFQVMPSVSAGHNHDVIPNTEMENNFNLNLAPGLIENKIVEDSIKSNAVNVTAVRKTRIVAEVKPMRMSYSDVLSKNVINESQPLDGSNYSNAIPAGSAGKSNKQSSDKIKYANVDKKVNSVSENENDPGASKIKKPTNSTQAFGPSTKNTFGSKLENSANSGGEGKKTNFIKKKAVKVKTRSYGQSDKKGHEYSRNDSKSSQKEGEGSDEEDLNDDDDDSDIEEYPENVSEYYNVRKNFQHSDGQHHNIEKISMVKGQSSYKKAKSATACSVLSRSKADKGQKRSTKIGGASNNRKRQKHEILLKIFNTWFLYLLKFMKWLYDVVFDVVYLSFGIIYDRSFLGYQFARQACSVLHKDVRANSGLWVKSLWKKFDGKFEKKSKFAFWRYIFKKKQIPSEQVKDYYKDGRLPTTADEAMKSLLNCKGKDAYSILGVSPNCSQEQIRKHYKKIAVLVHPDKNKQAGAEEAFKILQRSFELVGEAETRKHYDQSVAEACRSEKAWSELNDLLVQLQTKISEAANTIRCSSCCLRHPRKPTGRKPFAARECSTCKIRHPAREGDIWAETTFFGIRWKYLALMEGNVYDITDWANCQKGALSHLQPNSCLVQYKIVLGGNNNSQTSNQQQSQQHQQQPNIQLDREKKKDPSTTSEANLDDFLNNIYAGQNQPPQHHHHQRRRYKKN